MQVFNNPFTVSIFFLSEEYSDSIRKYSSVTSEHPFPESDLL